MLFRSCPLLFHILQLNLKSYMNLLLILGPIYPQNIILPLQNIGWGHLDKGKCGYYYLSVQVKRGTLSPPNRRWRWVAIKESCGVQTLWTISPRSRLSHSRLRPLSTITRCRRLGERERKKKVIIFYFIFPEF